MSRIEDTSGQGGNQGNQGGNQGVAQTLRDAGSQLSGQAKEQLDNLKNSATEYYNQGRDRVQEYYDQGKERAMEFEQNLEAYVREQPVKSLLIAAGVGCLLGILWRR
jgi:ElaB/YqjD/DUF883 family membrane-anchored ribosome-binding protein